jgi:phospholipid/cholesterol/gamma-HCH transport system permease protein
MATDVRSCWIDGPPNRRRLHLAGSWRLERLRALDGELRTLQALRERPAGSPRSPGPDRPAPDGTTLTIDGTEVTDIDTAGALLVLARLADAGQAIGSLELHGFDPSHARIVALVASRLPEAPPRHRRSAAGWLTRTGTRTAALGQLLAGHVTFLGRVLSDLAAVARRPALLRTNEVFAQLRQAGLSAIPVVMLVTFLIGIVFAYLLGLQAEQFGAAIFVVDGVALGMTRELSPLLVATIVAGRSGAAFTAQLGTMKLNEEIDAIRTLGLSPEQVLIVPRVIALVLVLPLLVFVGNVASLSGAMLMAATTLDITPTTFIDRLHDTLAPRHYVIGLAKAPVFALFIAVIGCRMGFSVARDTRSVGINTTSTVVQCIVAVILIDAFFAVLFQEMGL